MDFEKSYESALLLQLKFTSVLTLAIVKEKMFNIKKCLAV